MIDRVRSVLRRLSPRSPRAGFLDAIHRADLDLEHADRKLQEARITTSRAERRLQVVAARVAVIRRERDE